MTIIAELARRRVHVVEDDQGFREGLSNLLRSADIEVATFASPSEFRESRRADDRGCLLLDLHFPDDNGLDLQDSLVDEAASLPVIIMTGAPDLPSAIRGLKAGAIDFLTKPFGHGQLLAAIEVAMAREERLWLENGRRSDAAARYARLTRRERQVFGMVTSGMMNKQIACDLEVSEITVKIHRGNAMRKMGARTFADLVRSSELVRPVD